MDLQQPLPLVEECWKKIGVLGDRSCPELVTMIHCRNCPVYSRGGQTLFDREAPKEWIEEWTQMLARDVEPTTKNTLAVLIFRVGEEWLAIELTALIEVSPARTIHRVPHRSNDLFRGLVNIRGELQLCTSLRHALKIAESEEIPPKRAEENQRLLVIDGSEGKWALMVDEVAGVHVLPLGELSDVPVTVQRGQASPSRGLFDWDGRQVGLLAMDRLFDALQRSIQ